MMKGVKIKKLSVIEKIWGVIALGIFLTLLYDCIYSTIVRWDLPSEKEQYALLEREVTQINLEKYFIPVDNEPFAFKNIKIGSCVKDYYVNDNIDKTVGKFITIHKKNGWQLEPKNKHETYKVALVKEKIRAYIFEPNDKDEKKFVVGYYYRDGYIEK